MNVFKAPVFLNFLIIYPIFGFFIFSISGCYQSNKAGKIESEQEVQEEFIPKQVNDYLKKNLPGWTIAENSDYIKSWWSFYDRSAITYAVKTDINDDQKADYGLLIKKTDSIRFAVLIGTGKTYKHWLADFKAACNPSIKDLHYGLLPECPGQIDIAYPQIQSLILKSNGVSLMDYENRLAIFYWSGKSIEVFKTH